MSPAVERVLGWFEAGALVRPDPERPNTVDLSRALAALSGADVTRTGVSRSLEERIGPAEHLVFVLVDGLGLELVERLPAESFLRRHLALELRSVFPSATASAITALATGEWPARHGVPGWWVYLPEHELTAVALPFVERFGGRALTEQGITTAVYPARPLLSSYARPACTFQPAPIADSAYSLYFRGATPSHGYETVDDGVEAVCAWVAEAQGPSYSYFYLSHVDEVSHDQGPQADAVMRVALEIDAALEALHRGLAGRGRIVVSADHGQVLVPGERKHLLRADDPLLELLQVPPSGEPRVPLFHVRPGQAERFRAAFDERLGERFALLTTDEVEGLELFGPGRLGARTRERLGDFVGLAGAEDVLLYRDGERPTGTERLRGYHGGLLADEVRVPLILA